MGIRTANHPEKGSRPVIIRLRRTTGGRRYRSSPAPHQTRRRALPAASVAIAGLAEGITVLERLTGETTAACAAGIPTGSPKKPGDMTIDKTVRITQVRPRNEPTFPVVNVPVPSQFRIHHFCSFPRRLLAPEG